MVVHKRGSKQKSTGLLWNAEAALGNEGARGQQESAIKLAELYFRVNESRAWTCGQSSHSCQVYAEARYERKRVLFLFLKLA